MHVLAIIPARGGSRNVPRKNIRPLGGKPLLQYTAEAALGARTLERTILTTDDPEIADVGRQCGLELPFMRPSALAQDDTPTKDVVRHALEILNANEGYQPDIVVLLQPTAPLRTAVHIDQAVGQLQSSLAKSMVSIVAVPTHFHPNWQMIFNGHAGLQLHNGKQLSEILPRRQALTSTFIRNGAIYAFDAWAFLAEGSLYPEPCIGYSMTWEESINIDSEEDFLEAQRRLQVHAETSQ